MGQPESGDPLTIRALHQFVPTLARGDAIGGHTLQVRRLLRDMGLDSEVYVDHVEPGVDIATHHFRRFAPGGGEVRDAVLLYQASTGSEIADFLLRRTEPMIVNYHNITPASDFDSWEPYLADEMAMGRRQVAKLSATTLLGIADSAYNANELDEMGYASTAVAPILLDLADFDEKADPPTLQWLRGNTRRGGTNILFVGRLAPNKAQHDLVAFFDVYKREYDPHARLHVVGRASSGHYERALRRYVNELGLGEGVDFPGAVSHAELAAYYAGADVFVCLSDHEGFCVPLVEAMYHRVPVVAYRAAAVPETLGGAGIVLDSKEPALVAAAVHRVVSDEQVGTELADRGAARLVDFDLAAVRARWRAAIESAIAGVS